MTPRGQRIAHLVAASNGALLASTFADPYGEMDPGEQADFDECVLIEGYRLQEEARKHARTRAGKMERDMADIDTSEARADDAHLEEVLRLDKIKKQAGNHG